MSVTCFLLQSIGKVRHSLRCYDSAACAVAGVGYHDAMVDYIVVDRGPGATIKSPHVDEVPADAPWPTHCPCGFAFQPKNRQVFVEELFALPDGSLTTLRKCPPGSMWFADWMPESWRGPDGHTLMVRLPDGSEWCVDGPANNAPGKIPGWERSGDAPRVTARPSILTKRYHGFLTDGVLESC